MILYIHSDVDMEENMKSKKTREKILDESLTLFNHKKSSNVSTVQISKAMNISPGNLYYYFANKEEVVKCIWQERMLPEVKKFGKALHAVENADDMLSLIRDCFKHFETFRFFYTEISTLFNNDKELKKLYENELKAVVTDIVETYDKWYEVGHVVVLDDRQKYYFATNLLKLLSCTFALYDSDETDLEIVEKYVKTQIGEICAYLEIYFVEDTRKLFVEKMTNMGYSC